LFPERLHCWRGSNQAGIFKGNYGVSGPEGRDDVPTVVAVQVKEKIRRISFDPPNVKQVG
jgi:hypothetical protein